MLLTIIALVRFEINRALGFIDSSSLFTSYSPTLQLALQLRVGGQGPRGIKAVKIDMCESIAPAQPEELTAGVEKAQALVFAAPHGIVKFDVVGVASHAARGATCRCERR